MGVEIERKFLVDFEAIENYDEEFYIKQGYILNSPEKVVRVRVTDTKSYITIKGKNIGATRPEFEYEIPYKDATEMLDTMCSSIIEKTRHIFHIFGDIWEIDEFHGENEGLVVAEVEIPSEDYDLRLPNWIKQEVTDEAKYYNNNLVENPFSKW